MPLTTTQTTAFQLLGQAYANNEVMLIECTNEAGAKVGVICVKDDKTKVVIPVAEIIEDQHYIPPDGMEQDKEAH